MATNQALHKILKGILHTKEKENEKWNQKNARKKQIPLDKYTSKWRLEKSKHHKNNKMTGNATYISY
jgi:hypothetical protein